MVDTFLGESKMKTFKYNRKEYSVDKKNFLLDPNTWDENFASGMAGELGMSTGLTDQHWEVILFIRKRFIETGVCPVIYETSQALGLTSKSMQQLFPTGYLRGACLLAGISYKYGWVYYFGEPYSVSEQSEYGEEADKKANVKVYRVDLFGSLVDPAEWDKDYAARRAFEMNMKSGLCNKHWEIIKFLRDAYDQNKKIPTIYECCEANNIDLDEFAKLFPAGYHRGAVKIAGLPTLGNESD
jgi:tRNA 2-thiouridine synthesizing protein E